ncbi:hypothetical protein CSB09_00055 [Candidatus Gracilibacteria bacterium]|nr:MAG: hypothetical protein CSB09_00055 [Candidatus Gracilibacteria bacterium]
MKIQRSYSRGFTLVELLVAITIMGMMITTTLLIYLNIWNTSLRMQISKELSETARQVTDRISQDIREEGITLSGTVGIAGNPVDFETQYKGSGSLVLGIGKTSTGPKWQYMYGKKDGSGNISDCSDADKNNISIHCGLYIFDGSTSYNLVDSFTPDEQEKRVKITNLAFYISGDDNTSKKVTLKMTLELTRKSGIPASLVRATKLEIQSTFSDSILTYQK